MEFCARRWKAEMMAGKPKGLLILSFPVAKKMGISVRELLESSENQARGMLEIIRCFPKQRAIVSRMDLSVEAQAFGASVRFEENDVPVVETPVVRSAEDASRLQVPDWKTSRCAIDVEAVRQVAASKPDRPVFAGVIGPYSLAGRLMDVTEIMIQCMMEPDLVHRVLRKATDFLKEYIRAYKEAGAQGVVMAEPLAGLISPDMVRDFSTAYIREIVDELQDDSFVILYHNCGAGVLASIQEIAATGCFAYHFGNAVAMEQVLEAMDPDTLVFGNLDPVALFQNGTPEQVEEAVDALIKRCGTFPNWVVSSGCDIPARASWENIERFYESLPE